MRTYAIKIAVHGVSPMVWRRLRITGNTSLACLHYIIQITQNWTDDHLHQFHIYAKDYGIWYEGGLSFSDNAYQVVVDDFEFDVGDKFTYEYNFSEHWLHDIRIEAIDEPASPKKTPLCLSGHGMLGATEYDVYQKTLELLQFIVDAGKPTTMREAKPYIAALNAVRFNRHQVNHRLAELDLEDPDIEQWQVLS